MPHKEQPEERAAHKDGDTQAPNRALWHNRGLLVLWGGEMTSRIGESVFQIALLWYLLEVTQSTMATGLVTMVSYLPAFVVGVWSGVVVDRWDYRGAMLAANVARVVLVAALPGLHLMGWLPVAAVALLGFSFSSASAFFGPARDAVIPLLAEKRQLMTANSLVQSAWQFSLVIGPFMAAALLPYMPTVYLFFGVALAFALSGGILLALPAVSNQEPAISQEDSSGTSVSSVSCGAKGAPATADAGRKAFRQDFTDGLKYLRGEKVVFWVWVITLVNNFFLMGPVFVGMPAYVKITLNGTGSDFALVEGTYAGGMIVSTWLISRFGTRMNPLRMLFLALIYDGLTYVPLLWIDSVSGTVVAILVHSLGIPAITISRLTALHRVVPQAMQGRVFSYFHLAVAGMTALSIGVTGILLTFVPPNQLFATIGVLCALTGVAGYFIPALRSARV